MAQPMSKSSASGFGGGLLNFLGGALSGGLYATPDLARGIQAYQLHKARKAYEQNVINQHEAALAKQAFEQEKFDFERGQKKKTGQGNAIVARHWGILGQRLPGMEETEPEEFYSDFVAPGNIQDAQNQFYNIMNSGATGKEIGKLQTQQPQPGQPGAPNTLQAGTTYSEMVDPAETLMSQGAADWGDVNTRLHNNQTDENTDFSNQTTRDHYGRMDANEKARIAAQNARDFAAASLDNRTNPNLRGGGGGGNPLSILNSGQNFLQGKIDNIDKQLKSMGFIGEGGMISDSLGKISTNPKTMRAQELMAQRAILNRQLQQIGGAPFQNQSGNNMERATKGLYGLDY